MDGFCWILRPYQQLFFFQLYRDHGRMIMKPDAMESRLKRFRLWESNSGMLDHQPSV